MGSAQSSNVAEAVSSVTSVLTNTAELTTEQQQNIENITNFDRCVIGGDLSVKNLVDSMAEAYSVMNSENDADVDVALQQEITQQALSSVGALGIGFTAANNSVKSVANVASSIKNEALQFSSQRVNILNQFECRDTIIGGNVDIVNNVKAGSVQETIFDSVQSAVARISVMQSIDQKAKAEVAGLVGLIIAVAILLFGLFYSGAKMADSKVVRYIFIIFVVSFIGMAYFNELSVFAPSKECTGDDDTLSCGSSKCKKNGSSSTNIRISAPPMMYSLPIFPLRYDLAAVPNLLTQAHYKDKGAELRHPITNTMHKLDNGRGELDIDRLHEEGFNAEYFDRYSEDDDELRGHADDLRSQLCLILGIDHHYTKNGTHPFTPASESFNQWFAAFPDQGGTVTGVLGICNSATQRVKSAAIPLSLLSVSIVGIGVYWFIGRKKGDGKKKTKAPSKG